MTITKELSVDFVDKYPSVTVLNSHELNADSIFLEITPLNDKIPLTINEGDVVSASFVTDGVLIVNNRIVERKNETTLRLNLCNEKNKDTIIRPGRMLVEITITSADSILALPIFVIQVNPSILNNAHITDKSYGTVADIVREVIEARANFKSLSERFKNIETNVDSKANYQFVNSNENEKVFDLHLNEGYLYATVLNSKYYIFFTNALQTASDKVQHRISVLGIERRVRNGSSWSEWRTISVEDGSILTSNIADGAVTTDKLEDEAVSTEKLAPNAVRTLNIQDGSISPSKLTVNLKQTIDSKLDSIPIKSIDTTHISDTALVTSVNAGQAYAFANDTTIPTTATVKGWIENSSSGGGTDSYSKSETDSLLSEKITIKEVPYSETVFNDNVEDNVFYRTDYDGSGCLFFYLFHGNTRVQYRFTRYGVEYRTTGTELSGDSWISVGDIAERGNITSDNQAWYSDDSTRKMTGTYELNGDYCTLSATAYLINGWGKVYYSLPVSAIGNSATIAVNDVNYTINTTTLGNISVLEINRFDRGIITQSGFIEFTLRYKYK